MYITITSGIVFIEGNHQEARPLGRIDVTLNWQAQHKSLADVKRKMAEEARKLGANTIIDFTYGQKSTFWSFGDKVQWYGKGIAARLPEDLYYQMTSR